MASGEELRAAMRRYAAGVSIVTVDDDGVRFGLTAGSLTSVALEPPLVGVSIGHQSTMHAPLRAAGRFAVSLLAGDQAEIAQHFARSMPPIALWERVATRESSWPEPLIAEALAWLECRVAGTFEAGDHTIVVGEVLTVEPGRTAPALVYVRGEYRSA